MSTDRIEQQIVLAASPARVWRALTDAREFGTWFGVALDGPFAAGETTTGHITTPGYEDLPFSAAVERVEPEHTFAFRWHPYAIERGASYANEPTTLVVFTLAPVAGGTQLTVVESGFDALPPERRAAAFASNSEGWAIQCQQIARHVA